MDIQIKLFRSWNERYSKTKLLPGKLKNTEILLYALVGTVIFLAIYGFTPLIVTNDHWILNGYVEIDIIQHYTGWMAYRQSDWNIPLGCIDGLGNTVLTYTDSIPWVSIILKLFTPILPEVFQFFGWYILISFILQAIASGLMVKEVTGDRVLSYVGVIFFTTAPIMVERAFRHTALASHWLITFSIYLYMISRKNKKLDWKYIIIAVLAIGIHPYFLPSVFGIIAICWIEISLRNKKTFVNNTIIFICALVLTVGAGYLIGALGSSSGLGGWGYGYFSMNLNALFNPISCGNIIWSRFLPVLSQILGNYDGFNYIGIGGIALFFLGVIVLCAKKEFCSFFKRNKWLILLCIGFTVFAVSNVVTFDDKILIEYELPESILNFASIFRASSRIFYPVYYFILLTGFYGIGRSESIKASIIAVIILIVQMADISPGLISKHQSFEIKNIEESYLQNTYNDETWNWIFDNCSGIKVLNYISDYKLAAFCVRNGWLPDILISSSHFNGIDLNTVYNQNILEITDGKEEKDIAYITTDENLAFTLKCKNPNINVYRLGDYLLILSKEMKNISAEPMNEEDFEFHVVDISDENWNKGVSIYDNRIILFQYSDEMWDLLNRNRYIVADTEIFTINDIRVDGDKIWIYLDKDAERCQAPMSLYVR